MWNLSQILWHHQDKHKSHTSRGRKFAPVEGLSHDLVCTGSVHFAWQVWHGQLSPRFEFNKLKSFSGVEIDQNHESFSGVEIDQNHESFSGVEIDQNHESFSGVEIDQNHESFSGVEIDQNHESFSGVEIDQNHESFSGVEIDQNHESFSGVEIDQNHESFSGVEIDQNHESFSGVEIDQNHVDKRILGGKGFAVGRLKRHNFCPASVYDWFLPEGWWFRNPANQLRLVVEIPLFTGFFSTIQAGGLAWGFLNHQPQRSSESDLPGCVPPIGMGSCLRRRMTM